MRRLSTPSAPSSPAIEFTNDTTGSTNYGWVELATASTTGFFPATIVGYGYENTGAPITVGQVASAPVPEPTTTAALGLGVLSLGAAGVRRWRKAKQAVA